MSKKCVVGIRFEGEGRLPEILFSARGKLADAYLSRAKHLSKPVERMPQAVVQELSRSSIGTPISQKNFVWLAKLYVKLMNK